MRITKIVRYALANIKTIIAEGMNQGIKSFSDSLALEQLFLVENLSESFKRIAQDLAIRICYQVLLKW